MSIINILPYTLTNGTLADASQVMADFNQIVNNVNSATIGAAGVNLANTFLQLNSFQVGLQAGGTSQFGLDASGNLTTASKITLNSNILTLAGSLYTNTFNADGSATLGGPWAFNAACTFINPTLAQNPVTLTYANTTYAPIAGLSTNNFAANNLTVAGTLGVTGVATFAAVPTCSTATAGQASAAGTVIFDAPPTIVVGNSNGSFTTKSIGSYPNAKIAILRIVAGGPAAQFGVGSVWVRRTGSGVATGDNILAWYCEQYANALGNYLQSVTAEVGLNASQQFDYQTLNMNFTEIYLLGYRS